MFRKIGIIGVGLIGGSIALDVRRFSLAEEIIGYDVDTYNLNVAKELNIVDETVDSLENIVESDLIILAVPVSEMKKIFEDLSACGYGGIVTDVGSVKRLVIESALEAGLKRFIPAHPIAGTENFGASAAREGLFDGAFCIITPYDGIDNEALSKIYEFYRNIGMNVVYLSADRHDKVFAYVSHLPHVVAYALIDLISSKGDDFRFVGGGFKDFTRIAASSEKMWSDIFVLNKDNVVESIDEFVKCLMNMKNYIENGDKKRLIEELKRIRVLKREKYG